jgi:hypothetical protein
VVPAAQNRDVMKKILAIAIYVCIALFAAAVAEQRPVHHSVVAR